MSRVSPEWASATVTSHSWPQHQQVHITWHLSLSSFFNHRSQELELSLFVFCLSFLFCLAFFLHLRRGNFNVKPHSCTVLTQLCHICRGPLSFFFLLFFFWVQLGRWFVGLRLWFLKRWGEPQFWTCLDNSRAGFLMHRRIYSELPITVKALMWKLMRWFIWLLK